MKIVQAVNSMIANKAKITNVIVGNDGDFYFKFGEHKWSIGGDSDGYNLRYFPGNDTLDTIAAFIQVGWTNVPPTSVLYTTSDLKTREALQSFAELHRVVQEKLYDVDRVLDDIIGDDDPF